MPYRKVVSLTIAISFTVLFISGVLSYYNDYSRSLATVHTVFGLVFSIGIFFHIANNFKPLKGYSRPKLFLSILAPILLIFSMAFLQLEPILSFMNFGAKLKANSAKGLNHTSFEVVEMNMDDDLRLTIDLLRSEHYWHPQMAIWLEDSVGNYLETLFVSKATAQGLFYGGRSKDNFKDFDAKKQGTGDYRRVNALPVWSYKRNVKYADGMFVPPRDEPLPDAITGATLVDNFKMITSADHLEKFNVFLEINVAFDDNEYYSEYDFPDDEVYHNGTGQLGQPSIIFHSDVDMKDGEDYYIMKLMGHGHHSAQNGKIYSDLSSLTTAKQIVERIVLGVSEK